MWLLLQPRDLVNSHQLYLALGLLVVGLVVAGLSGATPEQVATLPVEEANAARMQADLLTSAEAFSSSVPADAPPIFPFLFITIACGACSGFHCLVSSGTSSKQVANERDAQTVGYGAMLLESALAVIVILACTAGVGMGALSREASGSQSTSYQFEVDDAGRKVTGQAAWQRYYGSGDEAWGSLGLPQKLRAFVEGGANFLTAVGIPVRLAIGIMAVLVASFAATTLDTATRLQRYVLQELAGSCGPVGKPLQNKYVATGSAVGVGGRDCVAGWHERAWYRGLDLVATLWCYQSTPSGPRSSWWRRFIFGDAVRRLPS